MYEQKQVPKFNKQKHTIMKRIYLAIISAVIFSAGLTSTINAQTKVASIENFSTNNSASKTKTVLNETPYYNKSGKLIYTIKRYNESGLPTDISRMIRNQFYDFDIAGVEEVVVPSDNNSFYFVHITNDKNLETVRVYNGESEVINKYKKG